MINSIVERIRFAFEQKKITAYQIAQSTSLTEVGVNKILNGTSKNPRQTTLDVLVEFLQNNYAFNKSWILTGIGNVELTKEERENATDANKYIGKTNKLEVDQFLDVYFKYIDIIESHPRMKSRISALKNEAVIKYQNELIEYNKKHNS